MLLRFLAENHRSIDGPVELSMIAVDEDRPAARAFDLLNERVLTVGGVYGANASGKSNVLAALAWLSTFVALSLRSWDDAIPREPFRFAGGPSRSSRYEIDLMVHGVRHAYQVELDDSTVLFEGLYSYPKKLRRALFEREGGTISFRRGLGTISGTRELLTPTTLALSAAMRFDEPEVRAFGRALAGTRILGLRGRRIRGGDDGFLPTDELVRAGGDGPGIVLDLLRFADLGIDDLRLDTSATPNEVRFVHRAADQELPFAIEDESQGTRNWYGLIGSVVHALRNGRLLLLDEIDASLHPRLSAKLIELFQDPETNPAGAQLVFTTHDTSLLGHLNRDEVWLTEKGPDAATRLTALAEYGGERVRRSVNLERAYLQGRFGAVPQLDRHLLRKALGLTAEVA
ncbi:ATP-binding protein [Dactylosporangium sp. NPDC005572]|uniref:AAA family ATPase n=1 Tax=Dactylosporangium sp. NPDC005572 TaxID=3156889 RepID=UPI00339DFB8F